MLYSKSILIDGVPGYNWLMYYFSLRPLGEGFRLWQPITYQFMHGGFSHILFNMFALWMFGNEIEQQWGSRKFLIFYLVSGIGGAVLQLLLAPAFGGAAPTIGASGSIFGVMIAFALMFPDREIYIYFILPVRAKYLIGFMIIINLLAVDDAGSGVAHLAHLGGAFAGFLFILLDKDIYVPFKNNRSSRGSSYTPYDRTDYTTPYESPYEDWKKDRDKVDDATYYDVNSAQQKRPGEKITQEDIDRILDKISRSGYQGLTDEEKRILFEYSKNQR